MPRSRVSRYSGMCWGLTYSVLSPKAWKQSSCGDRNARAQGRFFLAGQTLRPSAAYGNVAGAPGALCKASEEFETPFEALPTRVPCELLDLLEDKLNRLADLKATLPLAPNHSQGGQRPFGSSAASHGLGFLYGRLPYACLVNETSFMASMETDEASGTASSRTARLEACITPKQKDLFLKAAALTGRSLSDLLSDAPIKPLHALFGSTKR